MRVRAAAQPVRAQHPLTKRSSEIKNQPLHIRII